MIRRRPIPFRSFVESEDFYRGLDPGIRFAVRVLHAAGFETCQSCQGGKGHAYFEPTVDMVSLADDADGFGGVAALRQFGLPVCGLAIYWPITNGYPYEKLWRITFSRPMPERADDKPNFVWSYEAQ